MPWPPDSTSPSPGKQIPVGSLKIVRIWPRHRSSLPFRHQGSLQGSRSRPCLLLLLLLLFLSKPVGWLPPPPLLPTPRPDSCHSLCVELPFGSSSGPLLLQPPLLYLLQSR